MSLSFGPILRRLLPFALAAVVFIMAPHAPARADAYPQELACGNLDLNSASSTDAAKAFDCFNTAFSHCQPATLVASGRDAGVATTWTFMTIYASDSSYGNDNDCRVSETIERGAGSAKTTDASLCRTVHRDKDALRFTGCANSKDVALRLGAAATSTP